MNFGCKMKYSYVALSEAYYRAIILIRIAIHLILRNILTLLMFLIKV